MKVVIFDDELSERPALYRIPGIELSLVPHADDAVALATRERPDVVLMDFAMYGESSGAEAVAALRAWCSRSQRQLYIVAISNDAASNQRMLEAGADDAVPKTHVRGYLQKLLERQRLSRLSDRD